MLKKVIKFVVGVTLGAIVIYALLYYVIPLLPSSWQNPSKIAAASLAVLSVFASLAQITGISLRDVFGKGQNSGVTTQSHQRVEELIDIIQHDLYDNDQKLPSVLVRCSELAQWIGDGHAQQWLELELKGYREEYEQISAEMRNLYEAATYRLLETVFYFQDGSGQIRSFPYRQQFIGDSIPAIVEQLSHPVSKWGIPVEQISSSELPEDSGARSLSEELEIGFPDQTLVIYLNPRALKIILDGVRQRILDFLDSHEIIAYRAK